MSPQKSCSKIEEGLRCLLCRSDQVDRIQMLPTAQLVAGWRTMDIDISSELASAEHVVLSECRVCHLQFFPPELAGSAQLYAALQRFDWYYMPRKWEHDVALQEMRPGSRVLEVGCGAGEFVERLIRQGNMDASGIELNEAAVAAAQSLGRPVRQRDLDELAKSEPHGFDVVCCFQVLEHVQDPDTFLRQSVQLLKPGGRLIVCVPNRDSFLKYQYTLLDMPPHHVTRWSRQCLLGLAERLELKVCRVNLEPLATYHINNYVTTYADRARQKRLGRLVVNHHTIGVLERLIKRTGINRLLRGQSIYVSYAAK